MKLIPIVLLAATSASAAAPDFRPPFDKSDYKGSVSVQANPWFPLNKPAQNAYGGPNRTWKHYEGANLWAQGMKDIEPYGVTGWVPEINEPQAWTGCWYGMIDDAKKKEAPAKVGMFFGIYSKTMDESVAAMKRVLGPRKEDLRSCSHILRAGGHPVMVIYNPMKWKPEEWGEYFGRLDAEFGRMVYLMDVGSFAVEAARRAGGHADEARVDACFEQVLREYLPYCDGLSSYGNGTRVPFKVIRRVMDEYPQKVYEGQAHFSYTCHFHMGGNEVHLSEDWRQHLEDCLASDPDSILLTNLFDHYENSLVFPCYDREDFVLRYFECRAEKWRKVPFRRLKRPELVVTGHCMVQIGWQPLEFEVIGFPIDNAKDEVTLHLDLCDTSGKVLKEFPARTVRLDRIRVEKFSVPSTEYAAQRGVVPRLRYDWAGQKRAMNFGPMTLLDPSLKSYRMYWARSTKNELLVNGKNEWTMDGVAQGGTHHPQALGAVQFSSALQPVWQGEKGLLGCSRYGIRRDWVEWYFSHDNGRSPNWSILLQEPLPGSALHWYTIEMENGNGCKYQTLPIWETSGKRNRKVKLPVYKEDGTVGEVEVEEVRVPFWYYPMMNDNGPLLADYSGWNHHGAIRGTGFGGGHLGHTGYNHEHNGAIGPIRPGARTCWRKGADGAGYLSFNGSNDYVMVMGGMAFPGACTYELKVRPRKLGGEQTLVGSGYAQMRIDLQEDGRLRVMRWTGDEKPGEKLQNKREASFVSSVKLEPGVWSNVVVVYDLRRMTLYVNGAEAGSVEAKPIRMHEWMTFVTLGSGTTGLWTPTRFFNGDLGRVRISGRNLTPAEFLK